MKDYRPEPRLIIEVEGGLVSRIIADGIDLSHVRCFVVDYDTDGAHDEAVMNVGNCKACVEVPDIQQADDAGHVVWGDLHQEWAIT